MHRYFVLFILVWSHWVHAQNHNVILVLLDGVRWQEFYQGVDGKLDRAHSGEVIFKHMNALHHPTSWSLGPQSECTTMSVSNWVRMSLPGYQTIFSGRFPFCFSNDCSRIGTLSIPEELAERKFKKKDNALFASWGKIDLAAISSLGKKLKLDDKWNHNIAIESFPHPAHHKLNLEQRKDIPIWENARKDHYTYEHAMMYLKRERPRFLTISLLDSDEWGHLKDYQNYVATLKTYDMWIENIIQTLTQMGDYGRNTTVIVTTDHGRGSGSDWGEHGYLKGDWRIWMWVYGTPLNQVQCLVPWNHASVRPFIRQVLFGSTFL